MTSLTRKIAAATIAAATALGIAGLGVASATAADATAETANTGTLTVSSANAEFAGKTVTAWQMFTATPDETGKNAGYQVATGWNDFFTNATSGVLPDEDKTLTGAALDKAAADYVRDQGLGVGDTDNLENLPKLAKKAADWAKQQQNLSKTEATASSTAQDGKYTATFAGLSFGYYVVSPAAGSTSSDRHTDAILVNVTETGVTAINLKSTYPTVDKKVEGDNHSSAQIGDKVNFTLTSFVPDMSEYQNYTFKFVDTLSKGLTFDADSVTVKVGENTLQQGDTGYLLTSTPNQDGTTVTVDLSKVIKAQTAGAAITVTYSATLNENAVIGGAENNAGNANSVKVVYSNNPGTDETGESKPSITHTYAFDFDLKKVSKEDNQDPQALAGAKFQLQAADGTLIKLVKTGDAGETYRPAKTADEQGVVETVTTPESGIIKFTGLKEGTYQLVETEAPAGYNKLAAPIKVTIAATYNADGTLKAYTVDYGDPLDDGAGHVVTVVNKKGTLLPGTGGMGTALFTVLGVIVVALGAAWYVRSERKGAVRA